MLLEPEYKLGDSEKEYVTTVAAPREKPKSYSYRVKEYHWSPPPLSLFGYIKALWRKKKNGSLILAVNWRKLQVNVFQSTVTDEMRERTRRLREFKFPVDVDYNVIDGEKTEIVE